MKNLIIIIIAFMCLSMTAGDSPVKDCKCKDIPLYGKVKFVEHGADFIIKEVEHGADLHVLVVEHGADECGKWQFVEHGHDFTIKFVEHGHDFTVKFVEHRPGMP
jgi:hypothetical protein